MLKNIILVIAVTLFGLLGCGDSGGGTPEEVVQAFYEYTSEGKLEGALELVVVEKRAQKEAALSVLADFRDTLRNYKFVKVAFRGGNGGEETRNVHITEIYEDGREMKGGAKVIMEDGQWKIHHIDMNGFELGVGKHFL